MSDRYSIERELGRGGMAVVYLANDRKHDRAVALKVLQPDIAASLGAERFLREIRIAAKLNHPHILPLHDSGEASGFLYYVMPFVEGESLRDRLTRERQLPIDDALQITREVADGLGHAHSYGVIHRDIKPENILLSGGHAVIADFGIARAVSSAGATKLTTAGASIGTPLYMSPEQGLGDTHLDGRTDLYSLGCVLYEMLAGAPPFTASTAQAIIARHALDPIPRIRTVRDTVLEGVEAALTRALAKVPADRYGKCSEFASALAAAVTPQASSAGADARERQRAVTDEQEYRSRLQSALGDEYELGELIGRGGFAAVYVARDLKLDRRVAVKVVRPDLFPTPALLKRFQQEARAVARLRHAHIVPIYSVGEGKGLAYFIMPLIEGVSLRSLLDRDERLAFGEARRILVEAAQALQAAHREGVVHRDIKPDNIMLEGEDRRVLLMDFGIAKALGEGEAGTSTGAGVVVGTPRYVSPEQASASRDVDHRADIYALGVIGYQLLTGRLPFEGASTQELLVQHIAAPAPSLAALRPEVPSPIANAVMRCLEKDPGRRWESAAQLADALSGAPLDVTLPQEDLAPAADHAIGTVADTVAGGDCVLFFGLRVPADPADDPSGTAEREVSELLSRRLQWDSDGTASSLPRVAQQLEMEQGREEMLLHLREALENPRVWPKDLAKRIARIPFPVIVTTSYDSLLEQELDRAGRAVRSVSDCRRISDDLLLGDLVVRMFGSLDDAESVIVTEDDLWEFFERFDAIADGLKALFATRTLVFIGYDPSDDTFRRLFTRIKTFRTARTGDCYLVNRLVSEPALRWTERKGLQVVPLDPGEFLARLETELGRREEPGAVRGAIEPKPELPSRPYKFLNYYEEADERIFFGRDADIRKIVSRIHAYPLNLLYAPSGSGKTSLINAGLIPQLRRDGYVPTYARVYDDPEAEIRNAVLDASESAARGLGVDTPLERLLPQVAGRASKPVVLFLDQFEELFIRYDQEYRTHFAAVLQKCIEGSGGRVRFVLAMREDFLARLSEFRQHIPGIFHNETRLEPLTEEAARAAITEPAKLFGFEVEPKLVDRLITDLTTEAVEPPQLQIVCDTLYDALGEGETTITVKSYEKLGETRKILGQYLERVLLELSPDGRRLAREILKTLVTSEETKTVLRVDDIARLAGGSPDTVLAILAQMSDQRLVRRVPREEGYWYELTHEYLVEEIQGWLTEQERELKKVRDLLEQAVRNYTHLQILIPPMQAALIRAHEADLRMSKEEIELLRKSELAHQQRKKRIIAVAAAAVVFLALAGTAWRYSYLSSHWFVQAEDRELVAQERGEEQTARYEGLRMLRGSAATWWLDRLIGFPRYLAQTDIDVEDLAVEYRDRVKDGMTFSNGVDLLEAMRPMLRPVERVKLLAIAGDTAFRSEALDLYRGEQEETRATALDSLSTFLGHAGLADGELLAAAIGNTARRGEQGTVYSGGMRPHQFAYFALLSGRDERQIIPVLAPFLAQDWSQTAAIGIIGRLMGPSAVPLVIPFLESENDSDILEAMTVLGYSDTCAGLRDVRSLLTSERARGARFEYKGIEFMGRCGSVNDLALFESIARRGDAYTRYAVIRQMYHIGRVGALPAIRRVLAQGPPAQSFPFGWSLVLQGLDIAPDSVAIPFLLQALREVPEGARPDVSTELAQRGRTDGMEFSVRLARDSSADPFARSNALGAFELVRSPEIKAMLQKIAAEDQSSRVRSAAVAALRNYDDDETLDLLVQLLADSMPDVRGVAQEALLFNASPAVVRFLETRVDSVSGIARLRVMRILQMLHSGTFPHEFRTFLESRADTVRGMDVIAQAVLGLRDAYSQLPDSIASDALSSSSRFVRHGAMLALAERWPEGTSVMPETASRVHSNEVAAFTGRVMRWILARLDSAETEVAHGHPGRASAILYQIGVLPEASVFSTLIDGMAIPVYGKSRSDIYCIGRPNTAMLPLGIQRRIQLLWARIALARGLLASARSSLLATIPLDPSLRRGLRDDPAFRSLHNFYWFRVYVGLEDPREVESLN